MPPAPSGHAFSAWFQRQTRFVQGCLGILVLLFACGICSAGLQAVAGGGRATTSDETPVVAQHATTGPTATPRPTATPTATPKPKTWQSVFHKEGQGNTQTDVFQIKTGDHVVASCVGGDPDLLIVDLYRQGESYDRNVAYAEIVDFANEPCATTTYTIQQRDAAVYFRVVSDNVQWTLDVQRLQ